MGKYFKTNDISQLETQLSLINEHLLNILSSNQITDYRDIRAITDKTNFLLKLVKSKKVKME